MARENINVALVECDRCGSTEFCLERDNEPTGLIFIVCRQCDKTIAETSK